MRASSRNLCATRVQNVRLWAVVSPVKGLLPFWARDIKVGGKILCASQAVAGEVSVTA
jgi:hypothetical protein